MKIEFSPIKTELTGFLDLDKATGGLVACGFHVLGGASGMGKTTFALNIMRNLAVNFNIPVGFVSLEMTYHQIQNKLISAQTEVSFDKINQDKLEDYEKVQLHDGISKLDKAPIFIETSPKLDIDQFATICRNWVVEQEVRLIILDDIQRIFIDEKARKFAANREQEISNNVRIIKILARELNIPILAISQINRQNNNRTGDRKPMLHDLRDSGIIENDADSVFFLYREDYYGITEDIHGMPTKGIADLIIAKDRFNYQGTEVKLKFDGKNSKFEDWVDTFNTEMNKHKSSKKIFSFNNLNLDSEANEDEIVPF